MQRSKNARVSKLQVTSAFCISDKEQEPTKGKNPKDIFVITGFRLLFWRIFLLTLSWLFKRYICARFRPLHLLLSPNNEEQPIFYLWCQVNALNKTTETENAGITTIDEANWHYYPRTHVPNSCLKDGQLSALLILLPQKTGTVRPDIYTLWQDKCLLIFLNGKYAFFPRQ